MDFVELNLRIPKMCALGILGVAVWIYGHFEVRIGVPRSMNSASRDHHRWQLFWFRKLADNPDEQQSAALFENHRKTSF